MHPHLVLQGVAARRVPLVERGQPGVAQPGRARLDVGAAVDLDAEVVERLGGALAALVGRDLDQHQLERRLGDGEVGVAGAALVRLGAEQGGVELDRLLEVGDVEGELHTGHEWTPWFIDYGLCRK